MVRTQVRCATALEGWTTRTWPIQRNDMTISMLTLTPLISLIAGILILAMPRLLNYIVAIYLIAVGLIGLFPQLLN
jgi:hypothetical protein